MILKNKVKVPVEVFTELEKFISKQERVSGGCRKAALARIENTPNWNIDIPTANEDKQLVNMGSDINLKTLSGVSEAVGPDFFVTPSGHWYYPKDGGYMGWHTNSDAPFERLYLVYSTTGESWFKYYCDKSKKVVSVKDKKGWNVYSFHTPKDPLFWHCVYTECDRYSFGFRVV